MQRKSLFKGLFGEPARRGFALATALPLCVASAQAMELSFSDGAVAGRFDNTLSYGLASRTEGADGDFGAQVDVAAGRWYSQLAATNNRTQANKNDGNMAFPDAGDIVSNAVKWNSLLELTWENYGAQVSGFAFYDQALADIEDQKVNPWDFNNNIDWGPGGKQAPFSTTRLPSAAADYSVSDVRLSSAYVWGDFAMGERTLNVRLGEQVLSWGEALFLQDGINQVNPADLSALRLPGAEVKDALLPLPMLVVSTNLTDALSMEAFYQFGWRQSEADPSGSFYSTVDAFFGRGAESVIVELEDVSGGNDATYAGLEDLARIYNSNVRGLAYNDPLGTRINNEKLDDVTPKDDGQFGFAFRYMAESLNNTEFGLFFLNTHARKPTAGAVLGEAFGTATDAETCAAAYEKLAQVAVTPASCGDMLNIAQGSAGATAQSIVGGMNTIHYLDTSSYFLEYQEDQQVYGFTFSTNVGETSLSGEVAYRPEMTFLPEVGDPLMALNTINARYLGNGVDTDGTPGSVTDGQFGQHITSAAIKNDVGAVGLSAGDTISLEAESEAVNFSIVAIHGFGAVLGTDNLTLVAEVGGAWLGDLKSGVDYAAEGALGLAQTCTNLNDPSTCTTREINIDKNGDGVITNNDANPRKDEVVPALAEGNKGQYLDDFAWGYRLVVATEFNDVFNMTLKPQLRFAHDVAGNGIVGGNFVEDRMSATFGVDAEYGENWGFGIGTNVFWGAEDRNQLQDRDTVFANVKYSF
jgi:hypothetical protein